MRFKAGYHSNRPYCNRPLAPPSGRTDSDSAFDSLGWVFAMYWIMMFNSLSHTNTYQQEAKNIIITLIYLILMGLHTHQGRGRSTDIYIKHSKRLLSNRYTNSCQNDIHSCNADSNIYRSSWWFLDNYQLGSHNDEFLFEHFDNWDCRGDWCNQDLLASCINFSGRRCYNVRT